MKGRIPSHVIVKKGTKFYKIPWSQWMRHVSVDEREIESFPEIHDVSMVDSYHRLVDVNDWCATSYELELIILRSMEGHEKESNQLSSIEEQMYGTINPSVIAVSMIMREAKHKIAEHVSEVIKEVYKEHGIAVTREIQKLFGEEDGDS